MVGFVAIVLSTTLHVQESPYQQFANLTPIEFDGRELLLLGTAHVSRRSVEEVQQAIRLLKPDTVCVELDPMRYEALTDQARWRRLDVVQVIREKKVLFVLANLVLSHYQRRIGAKLGVEPGAEMLVAIRTAEEIGAKLVLADRNIQATLKRTWANLGWRERSMLLATMLGSLGSGAEVEESEIERLKDRDHLSEVMGELAREFPEVQLPLIDERDRYLISQVREASGARVLAVVGAGHVAGMQRYLREPVDRAELEKLPTPTVVAQLMPWLLPVVLVGAFMYGFAHQREEVLDHLVVWALSVAVPGAVGTVLVGGHPLTGVVAFLVGPVAALSPVVGIGMFTGPMEAWLRRPTVEDCEQIPEAMQSFAAIRRNRAWRVLLVVIASSIGVGVGNIVAITWLFS